MRVLISAGEASGDFYGSELLLALKRLQPGIEAFGLGGERLRQAGCDTVIDAHEIAVVGITEVLSSLARIRRRFHQLVQEAERRRPDVAVLIDFPDFNLRLAKQLHRRGVPIVFYVSPQVWAWRAGRVKLIRKYVQKLLVIFPFEVEWFQRRGVEAEYVGHPLAELPTPAATRQEVAASHGLDPLKPWIALLPGSRRKEVALIGPRLALAAALLGDEFEYIVPVAPTLTAEELAPLLSATFVQRSASVQGSASVQRAEGEPALEKRQSQARLVLAKEARHILPHARAAVVASGTATVEAALAGTPFVMVYRVAPSSYALGRWMVNLPHFAMPNLIAGRRVVPELVQGDFTAQNVVRELRKLLPDGPEREALLAGLAEVRYKLREDQSNQGPPPDPSQPASERAARAVLGVAGNAAPAGIGN